jgi:putative transposase
VCHPPGIRKLMLHRHQKLSFAGSIHFVTTVTEIRGAWFTGEEICRELLQLFEGYRKKFEVHCLGYVLMPDHLHALLYQESEGDLISKMMHGFKRMSVSKCRPKLYPNASLWRKHYDDVPIPGPNAARTRLEYMHANPVRRGLVERPEDYPWSSARDYMEIKESIVTLSKLS